MAGTYPLIQERKKVSCSQRTCKDILPALQPDGELAPGVLYSPKNLYIQVPWPHGAPLRNAARSFTTLPQRSGHPVKVEQKRSIEWPHTTLATTVALRVAELQLMNQHIKDKHDHGR